VTADSLPSALTERRCSCSRLNRWQSCSDILTGGVAERLIAPVLKTGRPKGLVSSNLTPSVLLRASGRFAGSESCFEPEAIARVGKPTLREAGRPPKLQRRRAERCIIFTSFKVFLREASAM
jgi:hypothetical protein